MELYLVKKKVKVIEVTAAFSMTNVYNKQLSLSRFQGNQKSHNNYKGEEESEEADLDRLLLKITNFPVALTSICSQNEKSEHSEKFARRVERKLLPKDVDEFRNLDLSLIISNRPNSPDGYFVISSSGVTDGSKADILKQLKEEFNELDPYGNSILTFKIEVVVGHSLTNNAAVFPSGSEITLKAKGMDFNLHHNQVRNRIPVQVPAKVREWWEQGTGFIHTKLTVKVALCPDAVDSACGSSNDKKFLLSAQNFKDLEISCRDGKIVKCHRSILADESGVFSDKLEQMLKEGKKGEFWKLKMEMSKEGVEAFLGYIYCGYVSGGLVSCDLALELHQVGPKYGVWGLKEKMEEIIVAKKSSDFKYFSVKGALDLFLYARSVSALKHLRDKAVRVLKSYSKTASDRLQKTEEYEDLFQNHPKVAMELSSLYIQLE